MSTKTRLINAEELKRRLEEGVWNDVIAEIDSTPTAFSTEKVIEQLEQRKRYYIKQAEVFARKGLRSGKALGRSHAYADSIEVVKAGGVSVPRLAIHKMETDTQQDTFTIEKIREQVKEWLDATGVIPQGTSYYYELLACIDVGDTDE